MNYKEYICPACGKKQNTAIQWQTVSVAYEFELGSGDSEAVDKRGGEHEDWTCPECGEELPTETTDKIEKILNW